MRVHFQNVDKAKEFYEFAAKSDPEFGYVDIFYSSDLSSQTTVLTNGGRSSVRASDYAYSVLEKNSDAYLLDISHSHPGKYLPNDGHYPAVPSGFDDNLKPTSRPGDRQGYIRGNKYDGRRPDYYNIFIPSKPTIKLKYNGDRVIRKL